MHHTPGRLRFKNPRLAGDRSHAARCAAYAYSLSGVRSVSLNKATGSFVIHYCPDTLEPPGLIALLNMHGGFGRLGLTMAGDTAANASSMLSDALVEAAITTSVELCVGALVKRLL